MSQPFLTEAPQFLFFTGKGGVGKTSLSCATAVHLADQGKRVLLTSTDPASNVGQVFDQSVGNTITAANEVPGLDLLEIDPEQAADLYRERTIAPVRGVLPESEIQALTEQLSGSCTTEIASFNEFTTLLADDSITSQYDHVIFDTAPTGHTIRLLQLPGDWTSYLSDGKGDVSCLGPLAGLDKQRQDYAQAMQVLSDKTQTRLVLVARAQPSSLAEANSTALELRECGMEHAHLAINALIPESAATGDMGSSLWERQENALAEMPDHLAELHASEIPLRPTNLMGLAALRELFNPTPTPVEPPAATDATLGNHAPLAKLVDELGAKNSGLIMCMGKGGVGKTTIASAIAVGLADAGHKVLLTTTDPAAHLETTLDGTVERLEVSRIDPKEAVEEYTSRIMASKGKDLDEAGKAALAEDLKSPCTEEVAVFGQFSKAIGRSRRQFVVVDTAPTGHTLLLLDTTGSYHQQITSQSQGAMDVTTPLMRLQDSDVTSMVIVSLPEDTPVLEAAELDADLRRADITPKAWVVNQKLTADNDLPPLLQQRAATQSGPVEAANQHAEALYTVPLQQRDPVGLDALRNLLR